MISNIKRVCLSIVLVLISFSTYGQNNSATTSLSLGITEVALLKVNTGVISLQLKQREAGLSLESSASDSTARLLISSVMTAQPRTLSARISEGMVPSGTTLQLVALQPNVDFVGSVGVFAPPIVLDNTDKPFVTEIMTCYSGTELSDGYPLKFIFTIDTNASMYGSIRATSNTAVTVTLTLTAAK